MIWVDFFLQLFVHALAWCAAISLTVIPAGYLALKRLLTRRGPGRDTASAGAVRP